MKELEYSEYSQLLTEYCFFWRLLYEV